MIPQLPIDVFVSRKDLFHFSKFETISSCFELLGPSLENFVRGWLEELGVKDQPIIKSKVPQQTVIQGPVYIDENVKIEPFAFIQGPCIIASSAEIRHGAYIRGNVYVGSHAVVGHTTEVKGSIFFDHAKAGHFAYVGDSILGPNTNLGAGTKLANLKFRNNEVSYVDPQTKEKINSGLRKFGSILGTSAQTGCNSVLSPGSLLLPKTFVLPNQHFLGTKL